MWSITRHSTLALTGLILVTFCAPLDGMFSPPGDWYASLNKPEWNPPSWIFGPVWPTRQDGWRPLWLYFTQLSLNAAWTPVFFGARKIGWALLVILVLWLAILVTLLAFLRVTRAAGCILLPYSGLSFVCRDPEFLPVADESGVSGWSNRW